MDSAKEAGKEMLRVVLIALIPIIIDQLGRGELDLKVISIVAAITFLRGLDKFLHEWGKESGSSLLTKGLTQF